MRKDSRAFRPNFSPKIRFTTESWNLNESRRYDPRVRLTGYEFEDLDDGLNDHLPIIDTSLEQWSEPDASLDVWVKPKEPWRISSPFQQL